MESSNPPLEVDQKGPLLKVLVLGESNSAMRDGWVAGFRSQHADVFHIDNRSIGSSGIFNALQKLIELSDGILAYDVVIIDSQINDNIFFRRSIENYLRILGDIFEYLQSIGVLVSILNFERCGHHTDAALPLRRKVVELSRYYQFDFYDLAAILLERAQHSQTKINSFYTDSAHPKREISFELGAQYGEHLKNLVKKMPKRERAKALPYFLVTAAYLKNQIKEFATEKIKNTLIDLDLFVIRDEWLEIAMPKDRPIGRIVGLTYNVARTTGFLETQTTFAHVKHLADPIQNNGVRSHLLWSRPFHTLVPVNGSFQLRMRKSADSWERTDFSIPASFRDPAPPVGVFYSLIIQTIDS